MNVTGLVDDSLNIKECSMGRFIRSLAKLLAKLFAANRRPVPTIHEDVVLSDEGLILWQQAQDPNSSVGKPKLG